MFSEKSPILGVVVSVVSQCSFSAQARRAAIEIASRGEGYWESNMWWEIESSPIVFLGDSKPNQSKAVYQGVAIRSYVLLAMKAYCKEGVPRKHLYHYLVRYDTNRVRGSAYRL